ncbi:MAG: cytochrome c1 [Betaproteobacteria bacterium]|nr:MAG: cytochrome c1 [Betaproteobacteria bacterium]
MKRLLFLMMLAPVLAWGAEAGYPLDRSPHEPTDLVSLQSGARLFVNYCLGCHSAQYMRYSRLTEIGLTEQQIRDNLLFTGEKVGDMMKVPMGAQAKQWFGVAPPDLSVVARSRGADWLYTYLRTFYRDPKTATGWNNAVFENVGMPHALWSLQGERGYDPEKNQWTQITKGALSQVEYDMAVRDLVNFLVYVGEPAAIKRKTIGIVVLLVLGVLFILTYLLKKEFWKDVK